MSPAAQAVAIPTRTEIEAWTTRHLADAASAWRGAAAASEDAFDQHRQNIVSPGGTTWEGDAKDAALDRVTRDTAVVGSQNEVLLGAADTAENGVTDINAAQREVLAAITAAEADGFRVGEDLSVTDTRTYDLDTAAARATAATEHAEDIRWTAERLVQADNLAGQQLQAKAAELEGIRFDGEGETSGDPTIQMVDHGTETEDPNQPPAAAPPDGSGPMSDAQIKSAIDEMLEGQDLTPAEAAQLADVLRNDLQGALDNGLNAEDAYTRAENAATTFMSQLHRSYIRKSTRLGIFEDALRTPDGDFLSEVSGDVIPAMRDAAGELIWVDQATGARVTEGAPNSMTIPEKGGFHLGHDFGSENWRVLRQAMEEGWTQSELNDFINNHEHFRLETPAENWGHAHEDRSPFVPNPAWTPDRLLDGAAAGAAAEGGTAPYISLPPNMPNVFDHPPVALPSFDGTHSPAPGLPPLAPTPGLPPWLIGPPEAGHVPGYNPLSGPFGVSIDSPPIAAPSPGWTPPDLSIDLPDVHVTPEDAAEAGGFLAGVGAALALLGRAASSLVHPFS
ncbi:HNH/ENDO VII family nuclease [Mycobacterium frederiksbergense]|uniref:HNH/ENDO VII family nuclease n=1 Tax=Mycolicibacterium frederiksbergense TaxID=117567 RepID=UPI0021F3A07E|nr:HNH/ENDO VII family nuclease [Mycolicibacterium frederiksbergense]MCV7043207.1 HNH/ENDO VII family nuclease [Mycolicibacterium frederiksbergense]